MKDSFVFYKSFYQALSKLTDKPLKADIYDAICELALNENEVELNEPMGEIIMDLISPQIRANNERYENGKKGAKYGKLGGRPKKVKNPIGDIEENTTETPNVNVNDNVNVNVNDNDIYKFYEEKYVRTLNAIEYETLNRWQKQKSIEEIKSAINQTAKAGIDNLKYVEKVLFSNKKKKDGWDDDYWNE